MNIIDIIVIALLLYSLWRGWTTGILVQLAGIAGVVLGAWVAFRFTQFIGEWLDSDPKYETLLFVAVIIVVAVCVIILCKLLTRVLSLGGLSLPINILGAAASFVKTLIVLALLVGLFDHFNGCGELLERKYLEESHSYKPLSGIAQNVFPYVVDLGCIK